MKLYLASFLQPQNFGPGRLISIVKGAKPNQVKIDLQFKYFIPNDKLLQTYYETKESNPQAGNEFIAGYQQQLNDFELALQQESQSSGQSIMDLLPFQDGDTLLSWERAEFTNYRKLLAPLLEKIGYVVVLN